VFYALKPAVVAIVIQALGKLARTGLRTSSLVVIAALAAVLNVVGVSPVIVLLFAGLLSIATLSMKNRLLGVGIGLTKLAMSPKAMTAAFTAVAFSTVFPSTLVRLFVSFLKIGSVVFGSGYVLLVFLRSEFVEHLHWLTERQLIDAVAVGQFTPGPVFTTATFIGFIVAGWAGAVVATVGIFLPGFLLVAVSGPLIPKLRKSALASTALDGVVAGSLALMAVVAWQLGKASIVDRMTMLLFVLSLVVLLRFRVNAAWVVAAAAVVGWFAR
jgi:chromate transporter